MDSKVLLSKDVTQTDVPVCNLFKIPNLFSLVQDQLHVCFLFNIFGVFFCFWFNHPAHTHTNCLPPPPQENNNNKQNNPHTKKVTYWCSIWKFRCPVNQSLKKERSTLQVACICSLTHGSASSALTSMGTWLDWATQVNQWLSKHLHTTHLYGSQPSWRHWTGPSRWTNGSPDTWRQHISYGSQPSYRWTGLSRWTNGSPDTCSQHIHTGHSHCDVVGLGHPG